MGKKSLTKSTTKKKTTTSKKTAPRKKQDGEPEAKIAAPQKAKTVKPEITAESKKPAIQSLLNKDFGEWSPEKKYSPESDDAKQKSFSSPPIIDESNPAEAERLKSLLSKQHDLPVAVESDKPVQKPVKISATPVKTEKPEAASAGQKDEQLPQAKPAVIQQAPKESAPQPPTQAPPKPMPPLSAQAKTPKQPADNSMKIFIACFCVVFALLFIASSNNEGKYYIVKGEDSTDIWKGKFSPTGKIHLTTLSGLKLSGPVKPVYTKEEALKIVFNYYVRQADEVFLTKGIPNFEASRAQLKSALEFAPGQKERDIVLKRLAALDFKILVNKANEASHKKTVQNIDQALEFLNQAQALNIDNDQKDMLTKKINELKAIKETLEKPAREQKSAGAKPENI